MRPMLDEGLGRYQAVLDQLFCLKKKKTVMVRQQAIAWREEAKRVRCRMRLVVGSVWSTKGMDVMLTETNLVDFVLCSLHEKSKFERYRVEQHGKRHGKLSGTTWCSSGMRTRHTTEHQEFQLQCAEGTGFRWLAK